MTLYTGNEHRRSSGKQITLSTCKPRDRCRKKGEFKNQFLFSFPCFPQGRHIESETTLVYIPVSGEGPLFSSHATGIVNHGRPPPRSHTPSSSAKRHRQTAEKTLFLLQLWMNTAGKRASHPIVPVLCITKRNTHDVIETRSNSFQT